MKKSDNIIQIAGISGLSEANLIINEGIKYLGFPLRLPVNKEDLSEDEAREIIQKLPNDINSVLITYQNSANDIIGFLNKMSCNHIQLHGEISLIEIKKLKKLKPDVVVFKSLVITGKNTEQLIKDINLYSEYCDAFITDTFDPETGASGATGKTHDWNISKKFVELSPIPVILAGGLNENNVEEAIKFVKPAGVDTHTGVEGADGRKDRLKIRNFYNNAISGFETLKNKFD